MSYAPPTGRGHSHGGRGRSDPSSGSGRGVPCSHGDRCVRFHCENSHPPHRNRPCQFVAGPSGCTNPACTFLHPKDYHARRTGGGGSSHGHASSSALALRGGRGGTLATFNGKKGKVTSNKSTTERREVRADGSVVVSRTVVEQVIFQPYGKHAGKNAFAKSVPRDRFGNVQGPEYDLSPDGKFKGQSIAVLQLYTGEGFTFGSPTAALERKGFEVIRWTAMPDVATFRKALFKVCQLWIVSGSSGTAWTPDHLELVQKLVDAKKGLFVWADNDPFTADANRVLSHLTQTSELAIRGNYVGDKVLSVAPAHDQVGFTAKHLATTGLETLYEGITISTIQGPVKQYRSLIRSSDGNVVTGCHDRGKVRILIDGGYTRLMEDRWDRTAGTARFVTNAACWLYNWEGRQKPIAGHWAAAKTHHRPPSAR